MHCIWLKLPIKLSYVAELNVKLSEAALSIFTDIYLRRELHMYLRWPGVHSQAMPLCCTPGSDYECRVRLSLNQPPDNRRWNLVRDFGRYRGSAQIVWFTDPALNLSNSEFQTRLIFRIWNQGDYVSRLSKVLILFQYCVFKNTISAFDRIKRTKAVKKTDLEHYYKCDQWLFLLQHCVAMVSKEVSSIGFSALLYRSLKFWNLVDVFWLHASLSTVHRSEPRAPLIDPCFIPLA